VDKYASGASEPTGLNLFNTENLFATPAIKTDLGMLRVLEVVAHEFFHYWSGNRVTIRDWFNLPFKEGLTTFRAAMFFEDLFGTDLARLLNGKNLDVKAPRQSSYSAVRSLYTVAAYEKAADVFRMMMLVVGRELFYTSMSAFLKNNDGKAVTIEEMLVALTNSTGTDLNSFLPWFTEPGIPQVRISDEYIADKKQYIIKVQVINQGQKPIPIVIGIIDKWGKELISDTLLLVSQPITEFHFEQIENHPIPSLLRSFSAPVHLHHLLDNQDLLVLMQYDTNVYNRCEAAKKLIRNLVIEYCTHQEIQFPSGFFSAYKVLAKDETIKPWILAELLMISSEEELIASIENPQFELLVAARELIQKRIAQELKNEWLKIGERILDYQPNPNPQFNLFDIQDAGMRRLKEVYYSYQSYLDFNATKTKLLTQFKTQLGINMTETISALMLLGKMGCERELDTILDQFYEHWKEDTHAMNYWFRIQAAMHSDKVVDRVKKLMDHPAFDILNPNKIYSLLGTFINNPYGFHNASGEGYQLIAKVVLILDKLNPPLAANIASKLVAQEKYDANRRKLMRDNIMILNKEATSVDVKNIIKIGIKMV
jgi:aminopeptidase N